MKQCSIKVYDFHFHLNGLDLLVILAELQRRTGFCITMSGASEGGFEFNNRPNLWNNLNYFELRFNMTQKEPLQPILDQLRIFTKGHPEKPSFLRINTHYVNNICTENFKDCMNKMIHLNLKRGHHYTWDSATWECFLHLVCLRRRSNWFECHVWPEALLYYGLLSHMGMDKDVAYFYMVKYILHPGIYAYVPRKEKRKTIFTVR